MKTYTFEAPSHWAPYLINGDSSGLVDGEIAIVDCWIDSLGKGEAVSCDDVGFRRRHDAWSVYPFADDCQEYAFLA